MAERKVATAKLRLNTCSVLERCTTLCLVNKKKSEKVVNITIQVFLRFQDEFS